MGKEIVINSLEEMCDLMCDNKEPTDEYMRGYNKGFDEGVEEGIKATVEPCGDTISRQAVIQIFDRWLEISDYNYSERNIMNCAISEIKDLPPVQPKRQTGKWIEHPEIETSTPEYLMFYECSECGNKQCFCKSDIHKKHFCNNCGAELSHRQTERTVIK